ncbi:MAG: hypothetical protein OEO19_15780 [Gammaproteobacteria bacterium]|nr:hypothetical protein [Gammaproteobacteria bacterium]MDH3450080.1 hypothetical protein [Gammaproteobacteria bacterium]
MNELLPFVASAILLSLSGHKVYAAGDAKNIRKLSNSKSTGGTRGKFMEQDRELATNIPRNILPHIKMPPAFGSSFSRLSPMPGIWRSVATRPRSESARARTGYGRQPTGTWMTSSSGTRESKSMRSISTRRRTFPQGYSPPSAAAV